ncbi:MAG TPA: hypothetical protein PLI66_02520 [Spirochaetales bacterium]|nr:hypothetical protein [Spirochaetales bacterium]
MSAESLPSLKVGGEPVETLRLEGDQFIITPSSTSLSDSVQNTLRRIGRTSPAATFRIAMHQVEPASAEELIRIGSAKQFSFVSLAMLRTLELSSAAVRRCPLSSPSSLNEELMACVSSILGTSGRAFGLADGSCLMAFYTHNAGDAELVAAQVARTLRRALAVEPSWPLATGPYTSLKLSGPDAEAKIRSFIDGL